MGGLRRRRRPQEPVELPSRRGKGFARSIRFDRALAQFLQDESQGQDINVADIVRGAVDDRRSFFGIPRPQLEKHTLDMHQLRMNRREYMQYLLSLRYEAIIQGHVDLSEPAPVPADTRAKASTRR